VRRADLTLVAWGLMLAVLGAVAVTIFNVRDAHTPALFGGAVLLMLVIGAFLAARRSGAEDQGDLTARILPDSSVASAWVPLAIAAMMLGAELGAWLSFIGAGMLIAGLGGLLRESRASRETAERALAASEGAPGPTAGEGRGPRVHAPGEE
jgi:hypothetical protein